LRSAICKGALSEHELVWTHGHRHAVRVLALATACIAVGGCHGGGSAKAGLPDHEVLGSRTSTPLTIQGVASQGTATVSEATARQKAEHPFPTPQLVGGLQQFGLAHVTASDLGSDGLGPIPTYRGRLAWVGVYEISKNGDHSCPAEPTRLPKNLPPVFAHYYFVVLVDATTGQEATWNEDMSGLLLRQCDDTA
jgi:hypothetical protein